MTATATVTYFLDILSSWCHWAEPTWNELRSRYAGRVHFQWRIALMRPGDFPVSTSQCDWFYQRSGALVNAAYSLDSGWLEPERAGHYEAPNWVAEAGREFLAADDERIRLALATAAMREGQRIGDLTTAARIASTATGLSATDLQAAANSPTVQARVARSTARFSEHQFSQRPAFLLESDIGDLAAFSGLWSLPPLTAALDAMLADHDGYARHGPPPPST